MASEIAISHEHRAKRQADAMAQAIRVYGRDHASSRRILTLRMIEEAFELAQTQGVALEDLVKVGADVFGRKAGLPAHEIGDLSFMLLCMGETMGIDLDSAEASAVSRFHTIDPDKLRAKNQAKMLRGLR